MERQSSNPGGAKENFFCCFWISAPRVSLCFSARAALKCLAVHFSMLTERSLLPTAQHFFHPAHISPPVPCSSPRLLCLSAAWGQGPGAAPGDVGRMRASLQNASCSDLISYKAVKVQRKKSGANGPELSDNFVRTVRELLPAGKLPWGQLKEIAEQRWCLGTPCTCRHCRHMSVTGLPVGHQFHNPHHARECCPAPHRHAAGGRSGCQGAGCRGAALGLLVPGANQPLHSSLTLRLRLQKWLRPAASPEM